MEANRSLIFLGIMMGLFSIAAAAKGKALNPKRNKYYVCGVAIGVLILLTEFLESFFYENNVGFGYVLTQAVVDSLSPFVAYFCYKMMVGKNRLVDHLMILPAVSVAIISCASIKTEWFFVLNQETQKVENGRFFWYTFCVAAFYFLMAILAYLKNYRDYGVSEKLFSIAIFVFAVFGIVPQQLAVERVYCMWPTMEVGFLLYYVLYLMLASKYDVLTDCLNRKSFADEQERLMTENQYILVVMDVNGLKDINDTLGHEAGDRAIIDAGTVTKKAFRKLGKVYRTGGDEFCIICRNACKERVSIALGHFEENLKVVSAKRPDGELNISYGVAEHDSFGTYKFNEVYAKADELMYDMKKRFYDEHPEKERRNRRVFKKEEK